MQTEHDRANLTTTGAQIIGEHEDALADELRPEIANEPLYSIVDVHDPAVCCDHHDGVCDRRKIQGRVLLELLERRAFHLDGSNREHPRLGALPPRRIISASTIEGSLIVGAAVVDSTSHGSLLFTFHDAESPSVFLFCLLRNRE
jgi:hypothetical protein